MQNLNILQNQEGKNVIMHDGKKTDVGINILTDVVNSRRLRIMLSNAIIDAMKNEKKIRQK